MAGYAIRVKASVERDIAALPRDIVPRILQSIEALSETPLPFGMRRLSGGKSTSTGFAWGTIGSYTPYTTRSRRLSSSTPAIVAVPTVDCDLKNSWDRRETAAMMGLSRRSFSAFLNDEPLYHRGHENH
jgi:hypothetical protein